MKFSTALVTLAAIAGGSSAFQAPALTAGKTLNNRIVGGGSALMAATMDGTSSSVAAAVNTGARRKKTKQVSLFIQEIFCKKVVLCENVSMLG